jgi:2-dehydropantoate 2-reductase
MKIIIMGIGGVGGYFGGLLALEYENANQTEVYFMARGENKKAIEEHGLNLETTHGKFVCKPKLVTDNPTLIGEADYIICCTKSYNLEESLIALKPCITKNTVILPLLNGVDSYERIKAIYPENEVWKGCVYIVARLLKPGVVAETGNVRKLFFGAENGTAHKLTEFKLLLEKAGISVSQPADIEQTLWEKFIFISSFASLTSYLDITVEQILKTEENKDLLLQLLSEFKLVADAKGINLETDIVEKTMAKYHNLLPGVISSMHSDFQNGKSTELQSITAYIINLGTKFNIPLPAYTMVYRALSVR